MSYAILTTNSRKGYPDMAGRINYMGGRGTYAIENCGEGCHVLIKLGKALLDISEPELMPPAGARSLTEEEMDPVVTKCFILSIDHNKQHLCQVSKWMRNSRLCMSELFVTFVTHNASDS
jgi:hypothetical protein